MDQHLATRLIYMVDVGRVSLVDDTQTVQLVQVQERPGPSGEPSLLDHVPHVQHFGFTSSPPLQSDVLLLRRFGNRTLSIAFATNDQATRPTGLQPGDAMLYDVRGAKITLGPEGIVIDGAGLPMTIKNVGGVLNVPGATIQCENVVTAAGVDLDGHTHSGVEAGLGASGPPST